MIIIAFLCTYPKQCAVIALFTQLHKMCGHILLFFYAEYITNVCTDLDADFFNVVPQLHFCEGCGYRSAC